MHSVLLFDSQDYRNATTSHMHNVLGFDHVEPATFRDTIHDALQNRYATNTVVRKKVVEAHKIPYVGPGTRFEVIDHDGARYRGSKLVLATGIRDVLPSIEGYRENWGGLIFHCLFCHGYEERGTGRAGLLVAESSQLLAQPPIALLLGKMARRFADEVTLFTHGNKEVEVALREAGAEAQGFAVEPRTIQRLERVHPPNHPQDGVSLDVGFLMHMPNTIVTNNWVDQLGLELEPPGQYKQKDATMETTVPGVFVAGDHASVAKDIPNAASNATYVASSIALQLTMEENDAHEAEKSNHI
ncbi:hypothetical protein BJY01DRAFT_257235 [Aspergillus pseudoustus]|uniref:FAD/NAD(P)-binding domain-containing protein n=1 Tax=Aspergillus pseudoustus TaxID=1810923 RepID=A0ABR4JLH6_9EURO